MMRMALKLTRDMVSGTLLVLLVASGVATPREKPIRAETMTEDQSRDLALSTARPLFGKAPGEYLRALRAAEYDEPFQTEWLHLRGLRAYVVIETGVEFPSSGRPVVHTSTGSASVLVLVDPVQRKGYSLRGLGDPTRAFNNLTHDLGVKIGTAETAEALFWIFADIAGGYRADIVLEPREAQWEVEGYWLRRSGGDGLDQARDRWLKRSSSALEQVSAPRATAVTDGFEVVFYQAGEGAVLRKRLRIGRDASVNVTESLPITSKITDAIPGGE